MRVRVSDLIGYYFYTVVDVYSIRLVITLILCFLILSHGKCHFLFLLNVTDYVHYINIMHLHTSNAICDLAGSEGIKIIQKVKMSTRKTINSSLVQ